MSSSANLTVSDIANLRQELASESQDEALAKDPALEEKAAALVETLTTFGDDDHETKDQIKKAVEHMGYDVQRESSRQSQMLEKPIKTMMTRNQDGGEVANALIDLKMQVEELDPARMDFSAGFATRLLGYLPFVGTPLKRYFSRFESAQTVIDAIIKSLEVGRETLKRDNLTLEEDKKRMRALTKKLEKAIALGQLMDQKISYKLERDIPAEDPRYAFIQEEVLFALRQRISDLQQQLAVNQQGILAMEVVIRNNKELVRGVNRALNVTVGALQVAVTVALALENQKVVLDKVQALSATTDNLIANTARRLKTQGAEIHKQAASTSLNMDTLKAAFADINAAMEDIARFRREALPQMATNILEMDDLNKQAEQSIQKMEQSASSRSEISLDLE